MQVAELFEQVRALEIQYPQFRLFRRRQGASSFAGGDQEWSLCTKRGQSPRQPAETYRDRPGDHELSTGIHRAQQGLVVGGCLFGQG